MSIENSKNDSMTDQNGADQKQQIKGKRRRKKQISTIVIISLLILSVYTFLIKGVTLDGIRNAVAETIQYNEESNTQNAENAGNAGNELLVEGDLASDQKLETDVNESRAEVKESGTSVVKSEKRDPNKVVSYKEDETVITNADEMYETYYVNPDEVVIAFPEKKRNVVYIYVESLEKTLETKENGGAADYEIMPYFTELQNSEGNVYAASEKGYQGYACSGGENTIRGTVSQTTGTPLIDDINFYYYPKNYEFVPGTQSLGDILKEQGYKNIFISGFDTAFAATDRYLTQHGEYQIIDTNTAEENGYSMDGYEIEWGFSDRLAFKILKDQILQCQESDQPFNITTATLDTHSDDVYIDDKEPEFLTEPHEIAFNGADSQVHEFLEWFKTQPSYEDTTIVISGDHCSHAFGYFSQYEENYDRTVYSVFINAQVDRTANYVKTYSTLDMFPSTLAAMGVTIEGNRLGLGANLFSKEIPLASKFGVDRFNALIDSYSSYYEKNIMKR